MHSVWAGREISAFEGLERYDGKLSRTVLRERRAVRPLATRYEINPERRVYIDSVRPISMALYFSRFTEL